MISATLPLVDVNRSPRVAAALARGADGAAPSDVAGGYASRTSIILFQLPAHWRSARRVESHAVAAACTCARARKIGEEAASRPTRLFTPCLSVPVAGMKHRKTFLDVPKGA